MLAVFGLLSLLVFVACGGKQLVQGDTRVEDVTTDSLIVTHYEVGDSIFVNPERGFYQYTDLARLDADIGPVRQEKGITLVWGRITLTPYRDEGFLPADFLADVQRGFDTARDQGMKVIVRGSYGSRGEGGDYTTYTDPPIQNLRNHVMQLAPIFAANVDVIALFEAGFIGPWGEWHTTTLANDLEQRRELLYFFLDNMPMERMVVLRYPMLKQTMFSLGDDGFDVVTSTNAYSGDPVARTGHHNDCFLSSDTDVGTYDRGGMDRAGEVDYLAQETLHTVFGGESCADYELNDCDSAMLEMSTLHVTYLNSGWHPDVLKKWETQGCMGDVKRRLGARFALHGSQILRRTRQGGLLRVTLEMENYGFASLYNSRSVEIVLQNATTNRSWSLPTGVDPRLWKGGEQFLLDVELSLPVEIEPGSYTAYLHLADPATRLHDDARYAYRLANPGVWDEKTGWNRLSEGIVIESAP